jgi:hypothetical protein
MKLAVTLFLAVMLVSTAQGQEAQPSQPSQVKEAAQPSSAGAAQTAPSPAPKPPSAPKLGPIRLDSVSAGIGGTESGVAVATGVAVSSHDREDEIILEMYNGQPVLRLEIDGRSRRLDVEIWRRDWEAGAGSVPLELNIELRTLQAESAVTIPEGGPFRAKFIVTPEVAASYSIGTGGFVGTAEMFIGAAGGVAADEDGDAAVLGIRIGGRIGAEYAFDDCNKVRAFAELDQTLNLLNTLRASPQISGGAGYEHLVRDSDGRVRNGYAVDFVGKTEAWDVERAPNADSGRMGFVGLVGTYSFSGL